MFERKRLTTTFGAAIALLTMSVTASASVPFELAVHEAARAARQQKIDQVLVVVRESSRSTRDAEIIGVLRAVEKMALDMLKKESGVEGLVDKKVREAAGKTKARVALRPSEVRQASNSVRTSPFWKRSGLLQRQPKKELPLHELRRGRSLNFNARSSTSRLTTLARRLVEANAGILLTRR